MWAWDVDFEYVRAQNRGRDMPSLSENCGLP